MQDFLIEHGAWFLGLIFLIDDIGIPLPAGTMLFLGAILARTSPLFPLWQLIIVGIGAPILGNTILFYAGRHGAKKWLHTHGHRFFLPEERLIKMEIFFKHRHGWIAVFLASIVTNMRPLFSIIAGSSHMPWYKFASANFLGISCWALIIIFSGYILGQEAQTLWNEQWPVLLTIIVALLTGWAWLKLTNEFFKLHRKKND